MTGHTCPVEGCHYGEQSNKSLAAVRSHINASGDSDHRWSDLKSEVEQQAESEGEQTEATENEENEDDTMPTDEEYREQYESNEENEDDGGSDSGGSSGFSIPSLDRSTMIMLLGVAAVLFLLYVLMNRDSGGVESGVEDVQAEEQADGEAADEEEVTLIE